VLVQLDLSDGNRTLQIRSTDVFGLVESAPVRASFVVDTGVPTAGVSIQTRSPSKAPEFQALLSCSDTLSAAGCVVTYVVRVQETAGSGGFVDRPPVHVTIGGALAPGATSVTVLETVQCPVSNGAIVLRVWARDGAGNSPTEPVESRVWVRDTLPPVTVAALASPASFFWLPAQNVSVTNASEVVLSLSSGPEPPVRFIVVASRANTQASQAYVFNVTGGPVVVATPWDGTQTLFVVRARQVYALTLRAFRAACAASAGFGRGSHPRVVPLVRIGASRLLRARIPPLPPPPRLPDRGGRGRQRRQYRGPERRGAC
jgi:hypothetical protein